MLDITPHSGLLEKSGDQIYRNAHIGNRIGASEWDRTETYRQTYNVLNRNRNSNSNQIKNGSLHPRKIGLTLV